MALVERARRILDRAGARAARIPACAACLGCGCGCAAGCRGGRPAHSEDRQLLVEVRARTCRAGWRFVGARQKFEMMSAGAARVLE